MKIDINPIEVFANNVQRICNEVNGHNVLYHFRYANGESATVEFDETRLDQFLPSKTVTEMMKSWEDNIVERIETITNALADNVHPYRMHSVEDENGNISEAPDKLDEYGKKFWAKEIIKLNSRKGSLIFEKII